MGAGDVVMNVQGVENLSEVLAGTAYDAKVVFNERCAIVFATSHQHRDMKLADVSYQDDYKGNALAAMIRADAIKIRFHRDFIDVRVGRIVRALLSNAPFPLWAGAKVTYQGRVIYWCSEQY